MESREIHLSMEEETRNGYTIPSEMKKVWKVELEILCELDRACKELGIKYFLDSGTLLGAARDGHFIPWDDDIDVIMLREDYDILVAKHEKVFHAPFFFQCAYTDVEYPRGHAQLRKNGTCAMIPYEAEHVRFNQSIFIDIFVMDGVTDDKDKLEKQFRDKNAIMGKMEIIGIPASTKKINGYIKKALRIIYKAFCPSIQTMYKQYEDICTRYKNTEYVDKIMFRETVESVRRIKREWYSDYIEIPFEGILCPVPIGYKNVLCTYFGDNYMTPAQAPTMHGGLIFDTQRSYTEVLKDKQ